MCCYPGISEEEQVMVPRNPGVPCLDLALRLAAGTQIALSSCANTGKTQFLSSPTQLLKIGIMLSFKNCVYILTEEYTQIIM